ncbi:unnamed protein product [Zymoseptoria tritici ST99CH_3D1]|nr:unnamed protein product [Zymoseptoria tritici ST99CH_3D1]
MTIAPPLPSPTAKWHDTSYESISPTRPELSANGKIVLITGGGTGIGAETALAFAAAGASRIALLGRREQPLLDTKAKIEQDFPKTEVFTASTDIGNQKEVNAAFDKFAGQGKIDVLISNAAVGGPFDGVDEVDSEKFMEAVNLNIGGNLHVAQAFARHAAKDAVVIEVSSGIAHLNVGAGFSSYAVSKMGVFRLWDSFAFKHSDMSVFHTQPGIVDTDMNRAAGGTKATGIEDHVSLPAHFNVWLASPEARFMKSKFLWSNWDVDELKARAKEIEAADGMKCLLNARGPDAASAVCIRDRGSQAFITCHSTVLSLRGSRTTNQPFRKADSESTLCWNGEAWKIRGERPDGNDTTRIFDVLQEAALNAQGDDLTEATTAVAKALAEVAGPYAFVFFDDEHSRIFFGRDLLGRRSLLRSIDAEGNILLCSVTDGLESTAWSEVEADGIYCIDLTSEPSTDPGEVERWGGYTVVKVPYQYMASRSDNSTSVIPELSLNRDLSSVSLFIDENSQSVGHLESLLRESVSLRVLEIPEPPRRGTDKGDRKRAKLAILFSGGLDCTTIARLCHDFLPHTEPIDLLNVAFENPRVHKTAGAGAFELCPDRITGRASRTELCNVCPEREWRFVAVDVPYAETQEHRDKVLRLMHPHNTEMDLSISFALYFAARGTGQVAQEADGQVIDYVSSARVLLSGLGADELFAGYTRHATAFRRNGFPGLLDELDIDIGRLGKRNLGRDDRVISNWGKEARFPFLDEKLVQWALAAPVADKCGFGESQPENADSSEKRGCAAIEPGKKVLRCLAWKLGMKKVAIEKKRAIQFGARTAKMETGKSKGTHVLT